MAEENLNEVINKNKEKILKWGLVGGSILAVYVFFWEAILKFAIGTLEIAIIGAVLLVLFFTYPAFCEFIASLGCRLFDFAIRNDPISRLRRDEKASAEELQRYEVSVSRADSSIDQVKTVIRKQKGKLTQSEVQEYDEQLKFLELARTDLISRRDEMMTAHDQFVNAIERAEAKYRIAGAFKESAKAFAFNKKEGSSSQGARIAMDEVDKQLAESHSNLKLIMSRPKPKLLLE